MPNTDVTKMAFFAVTDPKLITVDFARIDKAQIERRATMEKLNPPVPDSAQVELNKLRNQLFNLQQRVKDTETYANNIAGTVDLLEQRLVKVLREKKEANEAGNLLRERHCEQTAKQLESEVADAKKEHARAKRESANATRALKAFDGHARIAELKAQLETPSLP